MTRLVRLEHHDLGPRVYCAGVRVHECWAGLGAIGVAAGLTLTGQAARRHLLLAGIGAAFCVKDWPDFFPSRRNTCAWRFGVHRRPAATD